MIRSHSIFKSLRYGWFIFLLVPILAGCAIKLGARFDATQVELIQPGKSTQSHVRELMGSPMSEGLKDGKPLWTYFFAQVRIFGGITRGMVLTIEFDDQGIVESYSYIPY